MTGVTEKLFMCLFGVRRRGHPDLKSANTKGRKKAKRIVKMEQPGLKNQVGNSQLTGVIRALWARNRPKNCKRFLGQERGSGGVQSTGVSQRVRATRRDESQSVPSPEKLFETRDLELPFFEGSFPSCSPHSVGYTCTILHPYFPVANWGLSGPRSKKVDKVEKVGF